MGGKDRRLDVFLQNIFQEQTKKVMSHVENLTWDALKYKSKPKLRLKA